MKPNHPSQAGEAGFSSLNLVAEEAERELFSKEEEVEAEVVVVVVVMVEEEGEEVEVEFASWG